MEHSAPAPKSSETDKKRRHFLNLAIKGASVLPILAYDLDQKNNHLQIEKAEIPPIVTDPVDVNGRSIQIVGIAHSQASAEKYLSRYDQIISHSKAPHVVLEYFDSEILVDAIPGKPVAPPKNQYENVNHFFAYMGQLAASHDKAIYVLNPENSRSQTIDWLERHGIVGPGIVYLFESMSTSTKNVSRRSFLAGAATLSLAGLHEYSTVKEIVDLATQVSNQPEAIQAEKLSHLQTGIRNNLDWRDLQVAKRIRELISSNHLSDALVLQGALHHGVRTYLKDPTLAAQKELLYPEFEPFKQPFSKYEFNKAHQSWTKTI